MTKEKHLDRMVNLGEIPREEMVKQAAKATPKKKTPVVAAPGIEEGEAQFALFKGKEIRQMFHDNEWFFSIVDVIAAVTESERPRQYWNDLKHKLADDEDFVEVYDQIVQLDMVAPDGKIHKTDAVNVETLLRVVQSVPSKKAEPFKKWLAKVGYERILETQNPEISIKRAILNWQVQGRSDDWIEARLRSIVVRHELTDLWQKTGITDGADYGQLTNIISKATFGLKTEEHKKKKNLTSQSLRDHMTDLELVLIMLGEKSTTAIAKATDAHGYTYHAQAALSGGNVAGDARKGLEKKLGYAVVTGENFLTTKRVNDPEQLTLKKRSE